MRVAFIGQKGVPATHGGVERHVEELAARLAAMGHDVTVFTRPNYTPPDVRQHRGVRLVSIPTIGTKHLDAIVHSLASTLATWTGRYDVVHYHAIGPCLAAPLARLRGRAVVATIHGQDWRRGKWGWLAREVLKVAEWFALHVPHATICVSESLTLEYRASAARHVSYIPNGVTVEVEDDPTSLADAGVQPYEYVLFAGRLVPEKGCHHLLKAWSMIETSMKLVIAGGSSHSDPYARSLCEASGPSVVFVGYEYGGRLAALFRRCALFVLPSDLEGLPLVLLEALAYGAPVLASDIPPNVEVLGDSGIYFCAGDADDLAARLQECLGDLDALRSKVRAAQQEVLAVYDWDRVAADTANLYESVLSSRRHRRSRAM